MVNKIDSYIKNIKATLRKLDLINTYFFKKFSSENIDYLKEIINYNIYLTSYLNSYIEQITLNSINDVSEEMEYMSTNIDIYAVSLANLDINDIYLLKDIINNLNTFKKQIELKNS